MEKKYTFLDWDWLPEGFSGVIVDIACAVCFEG